MLVIIWLCSTLHDSFKLHTTMYARKVSRMLYIVYTEPACSLLYTIPPTPMRVLQFCINLIELGQTQTYRDINNIRCFNLWEDNKMWCGWPYSIDLYINIFTHTLMALWQNVCWASPPWWREDKKATPDQSADFVLFVDQGHTCQH